MQHLRDVERHLACAVLDLLAAGEAVREQQGLGRTPARPGEQLPFADLHGDLVLLLLEPERSRHAAATRVEHFCLDAHLIEELLLVVEPEQGLVVAVALHDGLAGKAWRLPALRLLQKELR